MAYISNELFIQHADKLAEQYRIVADALGSCISGTSHYNIAAGAAFSNYSMMNALGTGWSSQDSKFSAPTQTLQSQFFPGINADATHVIAEGSSSIDNYLTNQVVRVQEFYADAVNSVRSETLSASNVFKRMRQEICHYNGSASGVGAFTHVGSLGTGAGPYAKGTNYCAVQLEALVMSGIGSTDDLILKVYGTQAGPAYTFKSVTIPKDSPAGTIVDIGISTDLFVDISVASSQVAGGQTGDGVIIQSKLLRTISL